METKSPPEAPKTLWSLRRGEHCAITGYDDLLAEAYRVRLMEFGFYPGETVSCLQSPAFGAPKVFRVNNTIYSLDDEIADHILVEGTPQRD
tara:strand:- start:4179 stop:4451 length:273 start_codon:yes stop_codon:yes gene_type:complete